LLIAFTTLSQAAAPKTGTVAPPLQFERILQAPAGTVADWQKLHGEAVVMEFWATWCSGCRAEIPHLNRLYQQFRDKPVRFISVTDEEPSIVQRFLKDYRMSGWIALDSGGQTFSQYGVNGLPTTVLIDAEGTIRGVGNPVNLTAETIDHLLARRPVAFTMAGPVSPFHTQSLPDPLFSMMIRPAGPVAITGFSPGAISGKIGREWEIWGVPLKTLLANAYGVQEARIAFAPGPVFAPNRYDASIAASNLTPGRTSEILRLGLAETFQLKVHKELRTTSVYVLKRLPGKKLGMAASSSSDSTHWEKPGDVTAIAMPLGRLLSIAQNQLHAPVVDESGLSGKFDFRLHWDAKNPQSFFDALVTHLGLQLIASKRDLEYLVVDSAQQPKTW
jgi:uncharacterized protein (TIGR03435 family)